MSFVKRSVEMLCKQVCNVCRSSNLVKKEILGAQAVLDPQVRRGEVTDPPQSAPSADADGSRGVGMNVDFNLPSQILAYCLEAKSFARGLAYPSHLGFCRG